MCVFYLHWFHDISNTSYIYIGLDIILFLLSRQYAATIRRPHDVGYDPFTQSIHLLDDKETLTSTSQRIKADVSALDRALGKVERLTVSA